MVTQTEKSRDIKEEKGTKEYREKEKEREKEEL